MTWLILNGLFLGTNIYFFFKRKRMIMEIDSNLKELDKKENNEL